MRPVRLDLDGFAAFRDPTVVDFTDADYFALAGPTGSGKSTVIDAMTFALYGSAPRWGRENAIQYALAPTANRCTVRLVFDVAGQRYVVAREVRRIGKQIAQRNTRLERYADPAATGDPETDEPTESLAADPKAVRQQVTELLGLDFEDFCTCVVLPQGDFATFLQASVGQRQDILLKLLGARHYDAIGRLAGRRANDARARVDALTGELTGYADATEEAETAARRREIELVALLAVGHRGRHGRHPAGDGAGDGGGRRRPGDRGAGPARRRRRSRRHRRAAAGPDGGRGRLPGGERRGADRRGCGGRRGAGAALGSSAAAGWTRRCAGTRSWPTRPDCWPPPPRPRRPDGWGWSEPARATTAARETLETVRADHDGDREACERATSAVAELTGRIDAVRSVALPAGAGDLDAAVVSARARWQAARRALDAAETTLSRARTTVAELPERSALAARLRTVEAYETATRSARRSAHPGPHGRRAEHRRRGRGGRRENGTRPSRGGARGRPESVDGRRPATAPAGRARLPGVHPDRERAAAATVRARAGDRPGVSS